MGPSARREPVPNLPPATYSLVGREQDISHVAGRLRDGNVRLLTLTGPAGVGKTRLAIEIASIVAPRIFSSVWFVDLSSLNEPDLVTHAVSLTGSLREGQDYSLLETLTDALRSTSVLLILDNCEHLIGACATLTDHLLRCCPALHVLTTSRQPFGIAGEVTWPVYPLSVPDPSRALSTVQVADYQSIQMFVERAGTVLPGFRLTAENQAAVIQICHQLDGIPLALELAARWVTTLSVEQIADRMDDRLRMLSNRNPLAPARQQTLRDAVEWSYELLSDQEKTLFNRLSVFTGGCYLEAIEGVCAGDGIELSQVLHLLDRLVVQSLVLAEGSQGEMRYRLLETLRLFAREQLVLSGEADHIHQRHAGYYLALAESAESHLWETEGSQWMDRLEVEHENLRAVLRWTVGRGEAEMAMRFGAALCRFWRVRGHATEGLRWLERALVWSAGSRATRARALEAAGHLARDRRDYDLAEAYYSRCLELRREIDDRPGTALVLNNLGFVAQFRNQPERATALQTEGLTIFRGLNDKPGIALSLITLGTLAQLQGDNEQATASYEEGLVMFRELNDKRGIAASLNNLGNLASTSRNYSAASDFYQESLELFRILNDNHEVAACLSNLAGVAHDLRDMDRADSLYRDALNHYQTVGNRVGVWVCLMRLADIAIHQRAHEQAVRLVAVAELVYAGLDAASTSFANASRDQLIAAVLPLLSDAPLATIWEAVRGLPLLNALDLALALPDDHDGSGTSIAAMDVLTPRQQEIARLMIDGLTNRQIAEILFIAERTVDTHVEHIVSRLGVRSRTQIAVWAVESGFVARQ